MEERKNIFKDVEMYLKGYLDQAFTFYIDLETIAEIENGTFSRPYIRFTDLKRNYYIKVSEISYFRVHNENELLRHEIEKEVRDCTCNGRELPYFVF